MTSPIPADPTVKFPTWAKVLIALVVVSITGTFALGLSAIFGIKQLGSDMIDPQKIRAAATHIAKFPDPLPAGYHYTAGLYLSPFKVSVVTIQHEPDKQLLTFNSLEGPSRGDLKEFLDYGYGVGINMLTTSANFKDIIKRDTMRVGTYDMPYITGHAMDVSGKQGEGMVAALRVPVDKPEKNILIYALQTSNVPYNQQITMDLLNSIQSF